MALPASGEISFSDINTEIGSGSTTQLSLESAGESFELDTDPTNWSDANPGLGMDEFYGLSYPPAGSTFSVECSASLSVGVTDPDGSIAYFVQFLEQGELLGIGFNLLEPTDSDDGDLPNVNSGNPILVGIQRNLPDSTTADAGSVSINVTGTYSSITSPSGKSNPYSISSGESVDGGPDWTWSVNGVASNTKISVIIFEG